eukprot:CAMPEP_0183309402 /NCGR_PEP_ID=MMETSP0160_2-20130417/25325_1 /TAXON_ID=2839 ORGANISM="Odontella Sinensis, Strain Grunow 1884" /NCGR_SAMPLE_ID=MMETSP0160_2 /ASSEMBLY_ACC=CAM_ASM_000250 /LENGTH=202 /DNA_ID=CAMNT_0025473429 /DNA_START=251 /DNA_END=855 /DNA_ORIENTATION=-
MRGSPVELWSWRSISPTTSPGAPSNRDRNADRARGVSDTAALRGTKLRDLRALIPPVFSDSLAPSPLVRPEVKWRDADVADNNGIIPSPPLDKTHAEGAGRNVSQLVSKNILEDDSGGLAESMEHSGDTGEGKIELPSTPQRARCATLQTGGGCIRLKRSERGGAEGLCVAALDLGHVTTRPKAAARMEVGRRRGLEDEGFA